MKSWYEPPDFRYSFKSHFSYPTSPHVDAAGPAAAEAASASAGAGAHAAAGGHPPYGPRGYYSHGHGYGRHHWRPRFGLFRRMIWFGLGVGAASWYIHHKEKDQEVRRNIMSAWHHPPPQTQSAPMNEDKHQQPMAWRAPPPSLPGNNNSAPVIEPKAECTTWGRGWGARREERRKHQEEADAKKREAQDIKEAVQGVWAEMKKESASVKVQADDKTREYAKWKLEILTKALDKLREALDEDGTGKERKIV